MLLSRKKHCLALSSNSTNNKFAVGKNLVFEQVICVSAPSLSRVSVPWATCTHQTFFRVGLPYLDVWNKSTLVALNVWLFVSQRFVHIWACQYHAWACQNMFPFEQYSSFVQKNKTASLCPDCVCVSVSAFRVICGILFADVVMTHGLHDLFLLSSCHFSHDKNSWSSFSTFCYHNYQYWSDGPIKQRKKVTCPHGFYSMELFLKWVSHTNLSCWRQRLLPTRWAVHPNLCLGLYRISWLFIFGFRGLAGAIFICLHAASSEYEISDVYVFW